MAKLTAVQRDVKFDKDEYVFRATKDYEEGEEVFMNYGSHPNDTLLAECKRGGTFRCSALIDHRWIYTRRQRGRFDLPRRHCFPGYTHTWAARGTVAESILWVSHLLYIRSESPRVIYSSPLTPTQEIIKSLPTGPAIAQKSPRV